MSKEVVSYMLSGMDNMKSAGSVNSAVCAVSERNQDCLYFEYYGRKQ